MSDIVKLVSGSAPKELHEQLCQMAEQVEKNNKTVSTKLQAKNWDGRFWRVIKNFLAFIHIRLERTTATHVAEKLKHFIKENNEQLFDEAYYEDNRKNLTAIFRKVLAIDPASEKNPKSEKCTQLFNDCVLQASKTEKDIELRKQNFLEKYKEALEQLNKTDYSPKNVKEFLNVMYDQETDIYDCKEFFCAIEDLPKQLVETAKNLAPKNSTSHPDEELINERKECLGRIIAIASLLPFDETTEILLDKIKEQHPTVLITGISAAFKTENKPLFQAIKHRLSVYEFDYYWSKIVKTEPKVSDDWEIGKGTLIWGAPQFGNVFASAIKFRKTVLHSIAKEKFTDYTKNLLDKFLAENPDLLNFQEGLQRNTPLMEAVRVGNVEMAKWLLSKNADLSVKNEEGKDALKIAKEKANLSVKNEKGKSALEIAQENEQTQILIQLLQEAS